MRSDRNGRPRLPVHLCLLKRAFFLCPLMLRATTGYAAR